MLGICGKLDLGMISEIFAFLPLTFATVFHRKRKFRFKISILVGVPTNTGSILIEKTSFADLWTKRPN
jgi:hypothetical protein